MLLDRTADLYREIRCKPADPFFDGLGVIAEACGHLGHGEQAFSAETVLAAVAWVWFSGYSRCSQTVNWLPMRGS